MESLIAALSLGVVVFAATNIDDLLLLAALFADRTFPKRAVVLGQYVGIAVLFVASAIAAAAAIAFPSHLLAWLGLAPIAIGLKQLLRPDADDDASPASRSFLSVAAITVANGGDNLGVYIPLFATSAAAAIALWALLFMVMTALWCLIAHTLVTHPTWGASLRAHGPRVVPWVLIGLGVWILFR